MDDTDNEAKPFGQLIRLPTPNATVSAAPSIRSFTMAELDNLPARLDNPTMRALRDFYRSEPPREPQASEQGFAECLRTMRACLPSRPADDLDGQLMLAMYRHHLGSYGKPALDFLAQRATRDCRWFPTISECLEIIGDYRRADAETETRKTARLLFDNEDRLRDIEEREARLAAEMRAEDGAA